jgi:Zn-dependent peptidase ImmA (M78 family)
MAGLSPRISGLMGQCRSGFSICGMTWHGDRQRLSVAHELGHILLHQSFRGTFEDIEREADRFAAELLLPEEAMRAELTAMTISSAAEMKTRWGSSIQAIFFRARELSLVTERQYKYLCMQISKNGWRTKEPVTITAEKPRAIRKMAEILYGAPINYRKLSSEVHLPLFWVKRIIEAHASKEEIENRQKPFSGALVSFQSRK